METIRTARLHEKKGFKMLKKNLLGGAEMPVNMSLSHQALFDFGWIHSSGFSLYHKDIVDVIAWSVT
jgi:hypothetical protein